MIDEVVYMLMMQNSYDFAFKNHANHNSMSVKRKFVGNLMYCHRIIEMSYESMSRFEELQKHVGMQKYLPELYIPRFRASFKIEPF